MTTSVVIVLLVIATVLGGVLFGGRLPHPFNARRCQGKGWRQAFPSAPEQEIREFLSLFAAAFAFADKEKMKLHPDDRILDIYRSRYPGQLLPDALELETLALKVKDKYGFKIESVWDESLTLGQLYSRVSKTLPA